MSKASLVALDLQPDVSSKDRNVEKLYLSLSLDYAKNWTIVDALREIIANALDSRDSEGKPAKWSIRHDGTFAIVEDRGTGIKRQDLLLGGSDKEDSQIGQFGEGLKLALLVALRNNRRTIIETRGYTIYPTVEFSDNFQSDVPCLNVMRTKRRIGTTVKFECTKEELDQAKSMFLEIVPQKEVDANIYLPGGHIYVNGLRTVKANSLFSYNLRDKSLSNRDRTIIEMSRAQDMIRRLLEHTKSKEVIQHYLTGWKEHPNAIEYHVFVRPHNLRLWMEVVQTTWRRAVLSSNLEDDFIAYSLGYDVLRNMPTYVFRLASEYLGVRSSSFVASNHRNRGICVNDQKIVYPIVDDYVAHWTIVEALREFVANARDTKAKYRVHWEDGILTIEDNGPGLTTQAFVLGRQENKVPYSERIGQFGEGLKLACLALARKGRFFEIRSLGKRYTGKLEQDNNFRMSFLSIYIKPDKKKKGTEIRVECSRDEYEALMQLFLPDDVRELENGIIEVGNKQKTAIYVLGMKVASIDGIFSYNLNDKSVLNRDRRSVDWMHIERLVVDKLQRIDKYSTIRKFLLPISRGNSRPWEYRLLSTLGRYGDKDLWKKAIDNLFTKQKICFSTSLESDRIARNNGWSVMSVPSVPIISLLYSLGVPTSSDIATKMSRKRSVRRPGKIKDLPPDKLNIWRKGLKLFKRFYSHPVKLVKEFDHDLFQYGGVAYSPHDDVILVKTDATAFSSLESFVGTLIFVYEKRIYKDLPLSSRDLVNIFGRLSTKR